MSPNCIVNIITEVNTGAGDIEEGQVSPKGLEENLRETFKRSKECSRVGKNK